MDFKARAGDWAAAAKEIKNAMPNAKELNAKLSEVQGGLLRLEQIKSAVEGAAEGVLPKKLDALTTGAGEAIKKVEAFGKVAKAIKYRTDWAESTHFDLTQLIAAIKTLKEALAVFEKKAG